MPTPIKKATALVVQTPRMAIIRMSTSGSFERSSSRIQAQITSSAEREQAERLR